jgi:hypothetical protein
LGEGWDDYLSLTLSCKERELLKSSIINNTEPTHFNI